MATFQLHLSVYLMIVYHKTRAKFKVPDVPAKKNRSPSNYERWTVLLKKVVFDRAENRTFQVAPLNNCAARLQDNRHARRARIAEKEALLRDRRRVPRHRDEGERGRADRKLPILLQQRLQQLFRRIRCLKRSQERSFQSCAVPRLFSKKPG